MIFGIGTDIVEIDRVQQAVQRNQKLLERLFTLRELEYFKRRNMKAENIAGGFAAKEAILKSLGTGLSGMKWKEIEVLREDAGKPVVKLSGKALEHAERNSIRSIFISISHSRSHAMATAVAELAE